MCGIVQPAKKLPENAIISIINYPWIQKKIGINEWGKIIFNKHQAMCAVVLIHQEKRVSLKDHSSSEKRI